MGHRLEELVRGEPVFESFRAFSKHARVYLLLPPVEAGTSIGPAALLCRLDTLLSPTLQ
jgi:hypothetical protein